MSTSNTRHWTLELSLRYLWARRGEAFITIIAIISVLSIAIGVAALTLVLAIMTGFERELKSKIVGTNAPVIIRNLGGPFAPWKEAVSAAASVDGVVNASPFTLNQALLRTERLSSGVMLKGLLPKSGSWDQVKTYMKHPEEIELMEHPEKVAPQPEEGSENVEAGDIPGIIVGKELARNFSLVKGSVVSLLSSQVGSSPFGLVPRFKRFKVVGVFESGLLEYDERFVFGLQEEAQRFFRLEGAISGIEVRVKSLDDSPAIAAKVRALPILDQGFWVQDWTESNKPLWDAIKLERTVYFLVVLLIVVMASVSIVSMLVMLVLEKRRDIGVLKTLGATSKEIGRVFTIQGTIVGGAGTLIGLTLGVLGCWALETFGFPLPERAFPMTNLPVALEPMHVIIVGVSAFVISVLATRYPSRRASAVDPIKVLRFE